MTALYISRRGILKRRSAAYVAKHEELRAEMSGGVEGHAGSDRAGYLYVEKPESAAQGHDQRWTQPRLLRKARLGGSDKRCESTGATDSRQAIAHKPGTNPKARTSGSLSTKPVLKPGPLTCALETPWWTYAQ